MSEDRSGLKSSGPSGGLPANPQQLLGIPENADFLEVSDFAGINVQGSRASVPDAQVFWCHNMFQIMPGYCRAVPDIGSPIFTSPPDALVTGYEFIVTAPNDFMLVFMNDGSAYSIDLQTDATVQFAPGGTFHPTAVGTPGMVSVGLSGKQVACIVDPISGYFIYDPLSNELFQEGTVSPVVDVIDGGAGYTSAPTASPFGGSGAGVVLQAHVDSGTVSFVEVINPGAGYNVTDSVIVLFNGGGQGISAVGVGNTANGVITSLTLVSGGAGFTSVPAVTITPVSGGSGASAVVTSISGGIITGLQMIDGGSGYDQGATVTISGGTDAPIAEAIVEDGVVVSVSMLNGGSGYSSPPTIHYESTSGAGASGTPILVSGGIAGVRFDFPSQGGSGYQTPPLVHFSGGGGPASATIELMPFGVTGDGIESFLTRIWINDGNRIKFTAPGSIVDFGNGGGVFQSTDSFLRYKFQRLKQSNGFLYEVADSSVNYISNVTTGPISSTDSTLITTFTNLNLDPQIGTSSQSSVTTFSRTICFSNSEGVFQIVGGAIQKISGPVDRLFSPSATDNIPAPPTKLSPSAAPVQIFGQTVLGVLATLFDPTTKNFHDFFLLWDGRRWQTCDQGATDIVYFNSYQRDSQTFAYGTNQAVIVPLFVSNANSPKQMLSKLWLKPNIATQKKAWALYALFECYSDTELTFTVDSEGGSVAVTQGAFVGTGTELNSQLIWSRSAADAGGMVMGFTMTSTSADFAIIAMALVAQDYDIRM